MARPTRLTRQQQRIIRELIAKHDPLIRQAFEAAVQNAHAAVDFAALVEAVERRERALEGFAALLAKTKGAA